MMRKGFSILETIIIVAIFLLVLSSGFLLFGSRVQKDELEYSAREIVSFIDKARSYAISGYLGSHWGVRVINGSSTCAEIGAEMEDCLILYQGNNFFAAPTSTLQYYRLAGSTVYLDDQNDFYFEHISGWLSSTTANIGDQALVLKSTLDLQRTVTTTVSMNSYVGQSEALVVEEEPALPVIIDSYAEANVNTLAALYTGNWNRYGQTFDAGSGGELDHAQFYLKRTGSPTGNATAVIYAHTGTYGSGGTGTGSALATSDTFDVSTLSTSYGLITFNFSGANRITLSASTRYAVVLQYASGDGSNRVDIGIDTTSPTHGGNRTSYISGWVGNSTQDTSFYVYAIQ